MLTLLHVPTLLKTFLTLVIALFTLLGIMIHPFKLNEAVITLTGAALLLVLGLITPVGAFLTLAKDSNVFLFVLGMMSLSGLAEVAGLFDWLAAQAAHFAGNSVWRLYLNIFLLGSLITMFLSNDATTLYFNAYRICPGYPATHNYFPLR